MWNGVEFFYIKCVFCIEKNIKFAKSNYDYQLFEKKCDFFADWYKIG